MKRALTNSQKWPIQHKSIPENAFSILIAMCIEYSCNIGQMLFLLREQKTDARKGGLISGVIAMTQMLQNQVAAAQEYEADFAQYLQSPARKELQDHFISACILPIAGPSAHNFSSLVDALAGHISRLLNHLLEIALERNSMNDILAGGNDDAALSMVDSFNVMLTCIGYDALEVLEELSNGTLRQDHAIHIEELAAKEGFGLVAGAEAIAPLSDSDGMPNRAFFAATA